MMMAQDMMDDDDDDDGGDDKGEHGMEKGKGILGKWKNRVVRRSIKARKSQSGRSEQRLFIFSLWKKLSISLSISGGSTVE